MSKQEEELERLKSEVERLQKYETIVRAETRAGRFASLLSVLIVVGPGLTNAAKRWMQAYSNTHTLPREETAELFAAIIRRFTRIGILALLIAVAPTLILVWQNSILRNQIETQTQISVDELITEQIPWLIGSNESKRQLAMAYLTSSPTVAQSGLERLLAVSRTLTGKDACPVLSVVGLMRTAAQKSFPIPPLTAGDRIEYGFLECPKFYGTLWHPYATYHGSNFDDGFIVFQLGDVRFHGSLRQAFISATSNDRGSLLFRETELDKAIFQLPKRNVTIKILDSRLSETLMVTMDKESDELAYLVIKPWPVYARCRSISANKVCNGDANCKTDSVDFLYNESMERCERYLQLTRARSLLATQAEVEFPLVYNVPSPFEHAASIKRTQKNTEMPQD